MIIAGTIKNSVKLAVMDSKWQQKKQSAGKSSQKDLTEEERQLQDLQEQAESIREGKKPAGIYAKLEAGGKLTAEEIEYLKKNDPEALKKYEEVLRERKSYKEQLKNCKSKEEVEKLKMTKMGNFMAQAKQITNDPYIPKNQKYKLMKELLMKANAVEEEHIAFTKSLKYAELPDTEKEAREKEKGTEETAEETAGEEKQQSSLEEGEGGEPLDALEEMKKMSRELFTGQNAGAENSGGSKDSGKLQDTTVEKTGLPGENIDVKL